MRKLVIAIAVALVGPVAFVMWRKNRESMFMSSDWTTKNFGVRRGEA
jgi:hypothetical protein